MSFVDSLCVQNPSLVVVVAEHDGVRLAYGINPVAETFVFYRTVKNLTAYFAALVSGNTAEAQANAVDVPSQPPTTPWPNLQEVLTYAKSIYPGEFGAAHKRVSAA